MNDIPYTESAFYVKTWLRPIAQQANSVLGYWLKKVQSSLINSRGH